MRGIYVLLFSVMVSGCTSPEQRELQRGMKHEERGEDRLALASFDHVIKRAPNSEEALQAARQGAHLSIFSLKDFKKAAEYDRHLILNSPDARERENIEKQLAGIYFENLNDYPQAVAEYTKLLGTNLPFAEKEKFKIALSRSYFYLGEFVQAESEIDDLLKEKLEAGTRFLALDVKGNVLVGKKKFHEAAEVYKQIIREFPERARQENVALQLAVCYEEDSDFKAAIQVLEKLRTDHRSDSLELRLKRLQERQRNQPGAKGYRK